MDKKKLAWIAAGGLLLYFILRPKTATASPLALDDRAERAFDELDGKKPGMTDEQVNLLIAENLAPEPGPQGSTTGSGSSPAQGRYIVQKGEGWSQIAKKLYGDYRLWPWLWDLNRSATRYMTLADSLQPGDTLMAPAKAPIDSSYAALVFARADAYTAWYKNPRTASGRPKPVPKLVSEPTPMPSGQQGVA